MMKIEFDIPEFKREIKIEITLRRDGEVIYTESSTLPEFTADKIVSDNKVDNKTEIKRSTKSNAKKSTQEDIETKNSGGSIKGRGNMMDIEL